ncbi:MAG: hypothetical protein RLY70_2843 [Planctomycetota bacterium]
MLATDRRAVVQRGGTRGDMLATDRMSVVQRGRTEGDWRATDRGPSYKRGGTRGGVRATDRMSVAQRGSVGYTPARRSRLSPKSGSSKPIRSMSDKYKLQSLRLSLPAFM